MANLSVFGAGSWGTAFAHLASSRGHNVCLWCRRPQQARAIATSGRNPDYLEDIPLSPNLLPTGNLAEAAIFAERWVFAVPAQSFRELAGKLRPLAPRNVRACNLAKGFEITTGKAMSQVCHETLPMAVYSVLSGPCHAEEVVQGLPTAVVVASALFEEAFEWQVLLTGNTFRVYTNEDVTGVEIGGAVKNVVAIAAGITQGMGLGDNAVAALATRGLAEILRLGARLGANPLTLTGLAGVGDLMTTCYSRHSRNFRLGFSVGKGMPPEEALLRLGQVAEGYYTAQALREHADAFGVELPIVEGVFRILHENAAPRDILDELLLRDPKPELSPELLWGGREADS